MKRSCTSGEDSERPGAPCGTRDVTMRERSPGDDPVETHSMTPPAPANAHPLPVCAFRTCPVCGAQKSEFVQEG